MTGQRRPFPGYGVLNVTCVIEALLFVGLLVLLLQSLQPTFGGGRFVVVTLAASLVFLAIALTNDVLSAVRGGAATAERAGRRGQWKIVLRALLLVVALFGLILLLGIVVGMTIVAFGIIYRHIKLGWILALCGAVALGIIIPAAFGWAVGIILWPGLVPELLPGWIGGGILPPL